MVTSVAGVGDPLAHLSIAIALAQVCLSSTSGWRRRPLLRDEGRAFAEPALQLQRKRRAGCHKGRVSLSNQQPSLACVPPVSQRPFSGAARR